MAEETERSERMTSPLQKTQSPSQQGESFRDKMKSRNVRSACAGREHRTLNLTPNASLNAPYVRSRNKRYAVTNADLKNRLQEINRGYTVSCLEIAMSQNPPYRQAPGPIPAPLSATECKLIQRNRSRLGETPMN